MEAKIYKMICLTNMYVGSGESNFSVIDNEFSKDIAGIPIIHSSGVKGALRQFFEDNKSDNVETIFGSDVKSSKDKKNSKPGSVKFFDAVLVSRPARASEGEMAYYNVISTTSIETLNDMLDCAGHKKVNLENVCVNKKYGIKEKIIGVEGINITDENEYSTEDVLKKFVESYVILSDDNYRNIPLPVVARNVLEDNGQSANLWYDEIVPHKSVFCFITLGTKDDLETLNEKINNKIIQFGGNASIGRGFCKIEEVTNDCKNK